ncbi:MAG: hypothetical protein WCS37_10860 [Chloroflexota bacterium]
MAQNQKSHQKTLERQKAKRKQKQQAYRSAESGGINSLLQAAENWEILECLITRDWQSRLVQILIAKQSPAGKIVAGAFLVDLGCLGLKNVLTTNFSSWLKYSENLREEIMESQAMVSADPNLAAKIIRDSILYAKKYGFNPHPDFNEAVSLLVGTDPDASEVTVPLGKNGKPFFVAGPYDKADQIIAKLTKTAGPGNFHYMIMGEPSEMDDSSDLF